MGVDGGGEVFEQGTERAGSALPPAAPDSPIRRSTTMSR